MLDGGYLEAGYDGRHVAITGDALIHRRFDAHSNVYQERGALVLNLPLARTAGLSPLLRIPDPDAVARMAERSLDEAVQIVLETGYPLVIGQSDWPDMLATAIAADTDIVLGEWAEEHGLARETLSRGFAKCFGVTPKRYRIEIKTRRALAMLLDRRECLSEIAAASGFADQAHMSREIARLTGHSPLALSRSCGW